MAVNSKIEWTDHTFNPWWGCTRVSEACDHCYAESWANRLGLDIWGSKLPRRTFSETHWRQPLIWNARAGDAGLRYRVFCASMADVFEWKKELRHMRERLWELISETPNLDWLLLTKRPHLVRRLSPWGNIWPNNVWLGTTTESQRWVDKRLHYLLDIPAQVKFLSCEPLLGAIDISTSVLGNEIDWVIVGGESGAKARPSNPEWIRGLRDNCIASNTSFHFKQWGEWAPINSVNDVVPRQVHRSDDFSETMGKYGKRNSGRILDNRTWDEFPRSPASLID